MMREQWKSTVGLIILGFLILGANVIAKGQAIELVSPADGAKQNSAGPDPDLVASQAALQWFREAEFGLFVHWAPVCQIGKEISWSRKGPNRWSGYEYPDVGTVPKDEYDALAKTFNPEKFDARQWVELMKAVGMKYIVFDAKHHDGFCMFDSKLTDYDIMSTPYGRDILAQLAAACHEAGIRFGIYYSPGDWHHPDFLTEHHDRYLEYYTGQMRELGTRYGQIDIVWWDCTPRENNTIGLVKMLRKMHPEILFNSRGYSLPGDFDTPEQLVGRFQTERAWETCMTIGEHWSYSPNDPPKSKRMLVQTLVRCAGGNGNLLLNMGPMPDGRFDPAHEARLRELGQWNQQYGRSVFGTQGGPFMPGLYGASTYRGDTVYLHVLDWGEKGKLELPALPHKILTSSVLTGGKAKIAQSDRGLQIAMAAKHRDPIDTIIELKLDADAKLIQPIKVPYHSGSVAMGKPAKASTTLRNNLEQYGPQLAFDDDPDTRWTAELLALKDLWLEVDLETPTRIDRVVVKEQYERTTKFSLQYEKDGQWVRFYEGGKIGQDFDVKVAPIEARRVRLYIHAAIVGPEIAEFQLLDTRRKE